MQPTKILALSVLIFSIGFILIPLMPVLIFATPFITAYFIVELIKGDKKKKSSKKTAFLKHLEKAKNAS